MLMIYGGTKKIGHLKGENKWESSGSLNSNELDIDGLKAAKRNELVVPGQNITVAHTSDLRVPEAFCSLFWTKLETRLFVITVYLKHLSVLAQNVPVHAFAI